MKFMKSQSAMEYLMTYGWAILIIAVALAALFELGLFNPQYFAPKASPGSCSVFRPTISGSSGEASLSGVCNGQIPQFATSLASCPAGGNPVLVPQFSQTTANAITMTFWFNPTVVGPGSYVSMAAGSDSLSCTGSSGTVQCGPASAPVAVSKGLWQFAAVTVSSSGTDTVYVNGRPGSSGIIGGWGIGPTGITRFNIFSSSSSPNCIIGLMSNVQFYSTALSTNSMQSLYAEGIGGAPIDLPDLLGWWPLNGDVKDYSGNSNNAVSNGISFNGQWWNGYNTN